MMIILINIIINTSSCHGNYNIHSKDHDELTESVMMRVGYTRKYEHL